MAMWAGAVMEDGPYAPMTHSLGTNSIGIDPYLMVNQDGKRFANEDVGAQELQNAIKRQKGGVAYQIFDSKWKEQLSVMPQCFGGVTHYIPPEQEEQYAHAINHFRGRLCVRLLLPGRGGGGLHHPPATPSRTWQRPWDIPADALKETVERYNELAHAGKGHRFLEDVHAPVPRREPAVLHRAVRRLGHAGAHRRHRLRRRVPCARRREEPPSPALFVAGNTMGGRFLVDYPVTVAGASHSMAMSFGRLAGRNAAAGK